MSSHHKSWWALALLASVLCHGAEAGAQMVESIPFEMVPLGPSARVLSFERGQEPIPEVPASCLDILRADPAAPSGLYQITTVAGPVEVHCDMETDGGGYTTLAIDEGARTVRSTDPNDCHDFGMDIVIPRSRAHWASLLALYDTTYFTTVPGIAKPTSGGSFTTVPMNSLEMPTGGYQALDGRDWWMRDTPYTEPNGDYTENCWLSMTYWVLDDFRFNDAGCNYATTRYICSTNDKTTILDDEFTAPVPLGFEFAYFGQRFDAVRVSSHGRLSFDARPGPCCGADVMPSAVAPNNVIAGYWAALDIQGGGRIRVETRGAAPSRAFVVEYRDVPHADGGSPVTLQIVLREEGERVEVHCQDCPSGGRRHSQGVEGPQGRRGVTLPGRNLAIFELSNDAVAFHTDRSPLPGETWSVVGEVAVDPGAAPVVVAAYEDPQRTVEAARVVLLAGGLYSLPGLVAGDWHLRAFMDEDGDGLVGPMEPTREAGPVTLPPDALALDFDFRAPSDPPDAGVDAEEDAVEDAAGDPEADVGDVGAEDDGEADADGLEDTSPDVPGDGDASDVSDERPDEDTPRTPAADDGGGCSTLPGRAGGLGWSVLMGALLLALRRRRAWR